MWSAGVGWVSTHSIMLYKTRQGIILSHNAKFNAFIDKLVVLDSLKLHLDLISRLKKVYIERKVDSGGFLFCIHYF